MLSDPIFLGILLFVVGLVWLLVWLGKAGQVRRSIRKREPVPIEQQIAALGESGDVMATQLAEAWRFIARCYRLDPNRLRPSDTVGYLNDSDYLRGDLALPIEAKLQGVATISDDTPLIELAKIVAERTSSKMTKAGS